MVSVRGVLGGEGYGNEAAYRGDEGELVLEVFRGFQDVVEDLAQAGQRHLWW